MKLKRGIALLLAAVFLFGTLAVPASAAAAQPEPAAQAQTVDAEENDIISVRIKASGELTYGADHKLEIQTTPADAQYIGVVMGTSGQATGYVTLVLSEKIRILLKLIPLPKKMSATPDQAEEFNVYSYLKQLIDGNDVSGLQASGTQARPTRSAKGRTRAAVLLETIVNRTPAARIVSSHCCTVASSCWLPSPVKVLSTSSTRAVIPCWRRNSGVMASMARKIYSGVRSIDKLPYISAGQRASATPVFRYKERTGPHLCEPVLPFLWVNTVIENGGIAAAMAPDYLNLRLRAASDFFLRRTDGFS